MGQHVVITVSVKLGTHFDSECIVTIEHKFNVPVLQIVMMVAFRKNCVALKRAVWLCQLHILAVYLLLVYLVTALVPSETACLANSPGRRRRTAVWISLLVMVERLL